MKTGTNTRIGIGKRLFALLLSLCMLAGVLPVVAYSDGGTGNSGTGSGDPDEEEYVLEGVFNWPYNDDEITHTVYYKAD